MQYQHPSWLSYLLLSIVSALIAHPAWADSPPKNAADIDPIMVGEVLPPITLVDINNKPFDLNKAVQQKPTLLIFYRGGWCPYCNRHLAELRKIEKELTGLGFQIFAISPDLPEFLKQTIDKHGLNYTLLSDNTMAASKALGLAFELDTETLKKYQEYNIDLEKNSGQKHHLLPVPAALLVDTGGKVTFAFVAPDYTVRVDNEVLMAAARAQIKKADK